MNQLTNADKMLYLRKYIKSIIHCTYDKHYTLHLTTAAKKLLKPLCCHPQLTMELMSYSFLSQRVSLPITFLAGSHSIAAEGDTMPKTVKDIIKNMEEVGTVFGALFGFQLVSKYLEVANIELIKSESSSIKLKIIR